MEDKELLFQWVNDSLVRQSAFHTDIITYEEHCNWFHKMIKSENEIQFIAVKNKEPIGQIRLSIEGVKAYVDYSVGRVHRGKGYGTIICRLAIETVRLNYNFIEIICAKVKKNNYASQKCFENNLFKINALEMDYIEYIYKVK